MQTSFIPQGSRTPSPPSQDKGMTDEISPVPTASMSSCSSPTQQQAGLFSLQPVPRVVSANETKMGLEPPTTDRRQKRLERNRESARLSRRRRKQYLEVLEENVHKLSHDLDQQRRLHTAQAVPTIAEIRNQLLEQPTTNHLWQLEQAAHFTGEECRLVQTFWAQQLEALVLSPSDKFILWATLQTDAFFRGGRASSERLSAARIGERVGFVVQRNDVVF